MFFSFVTLLVYVWVSWSVIYDHMPWFTLLSLLTLPLGFPGHQGVCSDYDDRDTFLKTMGQNVMLVLVTQALIAAGYLLSGIFLK
jgi:1,4-dihydroxy-2-naphthoate octaprenyltransferase